MARACIFGSIATGLALILGVTDAHGYVVKKTSRGELVHWETSRVEYKIDPSIGSAVGNAEQATLDAMKSWSNTFGAPELSPGETGATRPSFDQKNGIFFMKDGWAPAGRALAITVLTYDNASGRILDSDIIFNGAYNFEVLPTADEKLVPKEPMTHPSNTDQIGHEDEDVIDGRGLVYDLHHVIAHELGHSLGMNDEMGRKDALMYRYSAPNDASIRAPADDDLAGIAELYSTKLEAEGNGCGSATVAPKKPSNAASSAAMFATLGLLVFLVLRARSDRRARAAFAFATIASAIVFVPTVSGGKGVARAEKSTLAHARAKVLRATTSIENGLFRTQYEVATTTCNAAGCPKAASGMTWGGTLGTITQEVGGYYAPATGDEVNVSFKRLPKALGTLTDPLMGRGTLEHGEAAIVTR